MGRVLLICSIIWLNQTYAVPAPNAGNQPYAHNSAERTWDEGSGTSARSSQISQADPEMEATWVGTTRWMRGINRVGGESFFGSWSKGINFLGGSSLTSSQYVPVELRFTSNDSSFCRTFRRDLGYASSGVGVFPGSAWDMSDTTNPRRLNICFIEANTEGAPNLRWDPNSTGTGKREYVLVMLSSYDGNGMTYNGANPLSGGTSMDILYSWWPQLEPGFTLLQVLPASMYLQPYYIKSSRGIPEPTSNIVTWANFQSGVTSFKIYAGTSIPPTNLIATVGAAERRYTHTGLSTAVPQYYQIESVDLNDDRLGLSRVFSSTPENMASSNVELVGYWHERSSYGGIWGYTDSITGKEYALVCVRNEGVSIIDIDVDPPVEVGFMPVLTYGTDAKEVKVYRHYVITCKETEAAQIFDVSDVTNPIQVATVGTGAHTHNVYKNYLILNGSNINAFRIYNITNPATPTLVSHFPSFYFHDTDIRNDTLVGAGIYGNGIQFVDIANPAAPTAIATFNYTGSGAHNCEWSTDGQYMFVGDEIGTGPWTRVFDVSNPHSVSLVSEIILDSIQPTHNSYQLNDTLYIGHYTLGIRMWDVTNPLTPVEIGHYDTYQPQDTGYLGCWTVYPYFTSGRLVASDLQTGLYVVKFKDPVNCCVGDVGNVDGDGADAVDISDLTVLIDHLFINNQPLGCPDEANTDGDVGGQVDISDLTVLIDHLFINNSPLGQCL